MRLICACMAFCSEDIASSISARCVPLWEYSNLLDRVSGPANILFGNHVLKRNSQRGWGT